MSQSIGSLKGERNRKSITGPVERMEVWNICIDTALDFSSSLLKVDVWKSRENTTLNRLRLNVCMHVCMYVCKIHTDAVNKTDTYGKIIKYVTKEPFLLFIGKERTNMDASKRARIRRNMPFKKTQ